jgi:hypothetical protein
MLYSLQNNIMLLWDSDGDVRLTCALRASMQRLSERGLP